MKEGNRWLTLSAVIALVSAPELLAQGDACAEIDLGSAADLHGYVLFPRDNAWNTNAKVILVRLELDRHRYQAHLDDFG